MDDSTTHSVQPGEPRMLGPYRLESRLGQGGMGEVYRATDTRLHRAVAVKLLLGLGDEKSRKRFEREAQAASALNHPHICAVYDVGEANGQPYLVMEYLLGETMRARISRGPLPMPELISLAVQVAEALDAAHGVRIVHRDIKPANIFITGRGLVKVMDFGIAARIGQDAGEDAETLAPLTTLTEAGAAIGTIAYMSPEQARGEPLDGRSDLFSLGVVLYEMATGQRPFRGATDAVLFDAVLHHTPSPPSQLRPALPPAFDRIVARLLEKEPGRRTSNATTLITELRALENAAPLGWRPEPPSSALPGTHREAAPAPVRRKPRVGMAAAAVVALALLAGGLWWWTPRPVHSLALLPFETAVGSGEADILNGLADAVTSDLSRTPSLQVTSYRAAAAFRGSPKPPLEIGRSLKSDVVVRVVAARSDDRLQLGVTAIYTTNGRTFWTATYDRVASDLFSLQRDLVYGIRRAINAPLETSASQRRPKNEQAYQLFLRGRSYVSSSLKESDLARAIDLLTQSTGLDADFGPTWAFLGYAYVLMSSNYHPADPVWREQGKAAIERAFALDDSLPEAHVAQGKLMWTPAGGFPHEGALAEFRKALEQAPILSDAWNQRGIVLTHLGHLETALRHVEFAAALDPDNIDARFRVAPIRVYLQQHEEAITVLNRVPRTIYPAQWAYQMVWSLIALDRLNDANDEIESYLEANPEDPGGVMHAARAMLRVKRADKRGALADIEEAKKRNSGFVHFHHTTYSIGAIYALMGELDLAEKSIEAAANDGFPNYTLFENDPYLAPLRARESFQRFLKNLRAEYQYIPGEE